MSVQKSTAAVVIGRNEGERLERCLHSLRGRVQTIVYVDSGSTDGSTALARDLGVEVVDLDLSVPFTAARARNAGIKRLGEIAPLTEFVQFVDGDCEIVPSWLEAAREALEACDDLAVVCGRRRERYPERSVYNLLCDMEWNTAVGETRECGGDALMRIAAFRHVGGYTPSIIAGEEPELCVRLRQAGWRILRLDAEMTLHDAAITRFGQFWKRCVRSGHAFAEGVARHGRPPERHKVRQLRSAVFWGGFMPLLAGSSLAFSVWQPRALLVTAVALLGYGVLVARIYRYRRRAHDDTTRASSLYAVFVAIGKLPECLGALRYAKNRLGGRTSRLIEYKGKPERTAAGTSLAPK